MITYLPNSNIPNQESNAKFANIMISNATLIHDLDRAEKHNADPIKRDEDIIRISNYLIAYRKFKYNLMFWMGISFGVRCGDLLNFRYGHLIDENGYWIDKIQFLEQKTKYTRGRKKTKDESDDAEFDILDSCAPGESAAIEESIQKSHAKNRTVYLNDQIKKAMELCCRGRSINRDDYIFPAMKNGNMGEDQSKPMTVRSVDKMFKNVINVKLGMPYHVSTHFMRKTFAYHILRDCKDRSRALEYLQLIFGHTSPITTLLYAGVTDDEIHDLTTHLYDDMFGIVQSNNGLEPIYDSKTNPRFDIVKHA